MNLILRELNATDENAFLAGVKTWDGEDLTWFTFDWRPGVAFPDMLARLDSNRKGIGIPNSWVPSTMFYGFVNGMIVGRLHVRHRLNENLLKRGGHIGYAVAPCFRKLGYAREMIRQELPYIRSMGIERMLVTCAADNVASIRLIGEIGGVLENEIWDDVDQEMICRYWVPL